jgi:tripartite-type tricarboxylate transporter receptor subunit TctC
MRFVERPRAALVSCIALIALVLGGVSNAQDYPAKPVQLLVPFPPGSTIDILARGFAAAMGPKVGQPIVVQNRAGGTMTIAMTALVQAPADGYTVLFTPVTPLTILPHRMKDLQYSRETTIPLCQNFENLFWLAVGPKSPFQSYQELIAVAKANPGKLRYATVGVASSPHLAGAELWQRNGAQLIDVPYPGEPAYVPNLLSNDIDMSVSTTTLVVTQKLRALAVFAGQRQNSHPNVPTAAELGHPIIPSGYGGLFVRSGTPAAIVARLEDVCRQAVADPGYKTVTERNFQQADYLDRTSFSARIDADFKAKAALIPSLKLPDQ